MTLSMYEASVPLMITMLTNLSAILAKAEAHAQARKIDPSVLLHSRLFPDMFPLVRQVQSASDTAKGCGARLAGIEIPRFEDTETSFGELQERCQKTIAFLKSIPKEQIEGSEEREVVLRTPNGAFPFTGVNYLRGFALPNFFFHVTTAYNILRHNGVELGKMDFLGGR